jgi:hypothetical protein
MKYKVSEVPQYISVEYNTEIGFGHLREWLEALDQETKENFGSNYCLDLIPDFQRGHVWSLDQKVAFVEHVLMGGRSGLEILFNATFYAKSSDGIPMDSYCVDGLQRISAVLDFLDEKFKVFPHLNNGGLLASDFRDQRRLKQFRFKVQVGSFQTRAEILEWYLQVNSGGTPHTKEELERVRKLLKNESSRK